MSKIKMSNIKLKPARPDTITITLQKNENVGLGFLVEKSKTSGGLQVLDIKQGGPAAENGLLRIGDIVMAVNQINLTELPYEDALKAMRGVPVGSKAVLVVRGPKHCLTHLSTRISADGNPKTVRFTQPEPIRQKSWTDQGHVSKAEEGRKRHENSDGGKSKEITANQTEYQVTRRETKRKMNGLVNGSAIHSNGQSISPNRRKDETLYNWENSKTVRDTLHLKACPVNTCTAKHCKGSVMNPKQLMVDPRTWNRTQEETQKLAEDFIEQYFQSTKRKNSEAHINRLNEVLQSIEHTGTYELKEPELIFGAKTAWRNAPRCIGRIQWNKLQVYDCRHVTTTAEMFEAICTHLKFATNKGNIRSCITFFPPRKDVETEFRVWNLQLIRYAGYQQNNGSVIGDPANVEFTQLCEKLGWKGPGGRFDVLPLLLQANGKDPDLYEIPKSLVLEVELRHPNYDWFKEMGLKWYAVPCVSNMLIDIGGVQFPGCPFNGWFMGTEIGRDLCDTSRYNILKSIAINMGLNTSNSSSLWKDKALLEMNVAVLHSYQTDRITIMDHHSATESFMKHLDNELKLRGGCPGDWVWLVPPLSGSATPVFHQEIFNYVLNPTCYYQPEPWKYYHWKNTDISSSSRTTKIRFKELAKTVLMTSTMMTKAMSKRIRATVIYATETGRSFAYATILQRMLNQAFDAKVICMEDYDIWKLEYESLLLVVTSTFGNGDAPENGETFAQALQEMCQNKSDQTAKQRMRFDSIKATTPLVRRTSYATSNSLSSEQNGILANVKFSVFGLGSKAYPNFCSFAHAIDTLLGNLEAERLLEIGEGDELCGQEESFMNWAKKVFTEACDSFCIEGVTFDEASVESTRYDPSNYRITVQESDTEEVGYLEGLNKLHRKSLVFCKLAEKINLQAKNSGRSTILVKLSKENSFTLKFSPGDHLGVYPCNPKKMVKDLIARLHDVPEEKAVIELEVLKKKKTVLGTFSTWEADPRLPRCSLRTAFSRYLDIITTPSPQLLKLFADCAHNEDDKSQLEELSKGTEKYEKWKFHHMPTLLDVLEQFPSVRIEASLLLTQLPLLQCRYYSISSSPDLHPGQVHLTVSVVTYRTNGGDGPLRLGLCSNYLNDLSEDEKVPCFIRHANSFHLPSGNEPCIFVGPGTGIAPFRSFWQQRSYELSTEGFVERTTVLIFGCRHPDLDHLYKKEVEEALKAGALSHSFTAYSRSPNIPKCLCCGPLFQAYSSNSAECDCGHPIQSMQYLLECLNLEERCTAKDLAVFNGKARACVIYWASLTYVQDIMENDIAEFVFDIMYRKMGHFYVCGDVAMADDVNRMLRSILMKQGGMSESEAETWMLAMRTDDRHHEDIFGVTLRTSEVRHNIRKEEIKRKSLQPS